MIEKEGFLMRSMIMKIKKSFSNKQFDPDEAEESYVELTTDDDVRTSKSKIVVRPFVLDDFSSLKPILDVLREGYTIALINIRPLKDKDLVELKRSISKLKKTTDAIEGDIAGFGEDWIAVVPSFATIYREKASKTKEVSEEMGEFD